jgi:hypothetical protein
LAVAVGAGVGVDLAAGEGEGADFDFAGGEDGSGGFVAALFAAAFCLDGDGATAPAATACSVISVVPTSTVWPG